MAPSPNQFVCATLGSLMLGLVFISFIYPSLCATGCGNLTEPVFGFLYSIIGPWGPRLLLLAAAGLFFYAAFDVRE